MSAEKIIISDKDNLPPLETPIFKEEKIKGRVDINDLLARARSKQKQETKTNFVFFGMFVGLVLIIGIILSF
tara:strand:- start:94 stop:309 length:216 start_codon:yes stop_codon:yes gene_type:complete